MRTKINDEERRIRSVESARRWRKKNPEAFLRIIKRWQLKNPDKLKGYQRKRYQKDADRYREYSRQYEAKLRKEVIGAYGGICAGCGESNPIVLAVDHIKNNGAKERAGGMGGIVFYNWLGKNGYPKDDYQLLCRNCNWIKEIERRVAMRIKRYGYRVYEQNED